MIGEALGNYTITAQLGSGTMGVVFRGEHARIARTAAIKVLVPELAVNASAVQRFFNEARATSLIRHPGIVDVFDCDVDDAGRAYIVMEHLDGETLADRLRRTDAIPCAAACTIARQVAEAIAAAHDRGIVHRDLKPENVFLVRDPAGADEVGRVKVLDFGIAKLLAADASARLTMRGMALGTPEYMAPEQCGGSDEIDERADIYALGCILFEMLSGEPPFVAETIQELFAAHMFLPSPSIGERVPGLPARLAGLVTSMLAKERDHRPTSMRAVARALGATTKGAPSAVRGVTSRWLGRAAPFAVAIVGVSALVAAIWHGGRSNPRASRRGSADVAIAPAPAAMPSPPSTAVGAPSPPLPVAVLPVQAAAAIAAARDAPIPPPARKRARAEAGAQRPSPPSPPGSSKTQHLVDSDGIVDL